MQKSSKHLAQNIAAATKALAQRKRPANDRLSNVPAREHLGPTPEQAGRFTDTRVQVRTEKGQVTGLAYRARPYFETMAETPANRTAPDGPRLISLEQLRALRFYRDAWERSQASETRCALNIEGVSGGIPSRMPAVLLSDGRVQAIDKAMGPIGSTLRAVALHDMSFSGVAVQRFGGRERERIDVGAERPGFRTEIVPKSGRHREIIRDEFFRALSILVETATQLRVYDQG